MIASNSSCGGLSNTLEGLPYLFVYREEREGRGGGERRGRVREEDMRER